VFAVPYFMQQLMGMSALKAGLWTLPHAIAAGIAMPIGGRLYDRVGARPLVFTGLLFAGIGAFLLSFIDPSNSPWTFLVPRALIGLGMGMSFLALNTHLIQNAPRELVGRVTSLTSAAQQVVTSFAVAGLTTFIVSRTTHYVSQGETVMSDAMTHAYHNAYVVLAALAAVSLLLAATLKRTTADRTEAPVGVAEL